MSYRGRPPSIYRLLSFLKLNNRMCGPSKDATVKYLSLRSGLLAICQERRWLEPDSPVAVPTRSGLYTCHQVLSSASWPSTYSLRAVCFGVGISVILTPSRNPQTQGMAASPCSSCHLKSKPKGVTAQPSLAQLGLAARAASPLPATPGASARPTERCWCVLVEQPALLTN